MNLSRIGDVLYLCAITVLVLTIQGFIKSKEITVEEASLSLHHYPTSFSDHVASQLNSFNFVSLLDSLGQSDDEKTFPNIRSRPLRLMVSLLTKDENHKKNRGKEISYFQEEGLEAVIVQVSTALSDPRDAFLVAIPINLVGDPTMVGPSLGVTLINNLRDVPWLGKKTIFIFLTKETRLGHQDLSLVIDKALQSPKAKLDVGLLRLAFVMEIDENLELGQVDLDIEGQSGKLPNQDLLNMFKSEVTATNRRLDVTHRQGPRMMMKLAFERNIGLHEAFLSHQIPAFTMRSSSMTIRSMLIRPLEVYIRGLGATTQTLHHSFNFYILIGNDHHISNSSYMIPVLILVGSLLIWCRFECDLHQLTLGTGWTISFFGFFVWLFINIQRIVAAPSNLDNIQQIVALMFALLVCEFVRPELLKLFAKLSHRPMAPLTGSMYLLIAAFILSSLFFDGCKALMFGPILAAMVRIPQLCPKLSRPLAWTATIAGCLILFGTKPSHSLVLHVLVLVFIQLVA